MLRADQLVSLLRKLTWYPVIDLTCDGAGTNTLGPLFYSAFRDMLRQKVHLVGKDLVCNPPYSHIEDAFNFLEDLGQTDRTTRALFIIAHRNKPFWDQLLESPHWHIVKVWLPPANLFTNCKPNTEMVVDERENAGPFPSICVAWELNFDKQSDSMATWKQVLLCHKDIVEAVDEKIRQDEVIAELTAANI